MKKSFNINITVPETLEEFQAQNNTPLEAVLDPSSPLPPGLPIDIYVHDHCLRRGTKCESRLCPIALALIQHFGTKDVMVLSCAIYIGDQIYRMNEPLINKLGDFDHGLIVEPYHFTLR